MKEAYFLNIQPFFMTSSINFNLDSLHTIQVQYKIICELILNLSNKYCKEASILRVSKQRSTLQDDVHRITEWVEGTLFQAPCHGQGRFPLDRVAQSPVQLGFEHFQQCSIHNFCGQQFPVSHQLHTKEFLPNI